ncbi:MAG: type I restriction enzyme HsdR N-terminal domain-containing protein [Bacteroidetes bacterium]|nr:type I restriction enzyme HsdR N-terminal domain-containing protein [Bacteroidota bacterium]
MKTLDLPPFEYKIKRENNGTKIFDIIRRKYIVLTPEEWVRQHFVHYLIDQLHYPRTLINIESGLKYNQLRKRSDIVVYDKSGSSFLLVECKSASSKISKNAIFQAATYNHSIKAKYVAITNGLSFVCCKVSKDSGQLTWVENLPAFME